ncbi:MAG: HAMP domain-containing sensor histidine kinase, partial [Pseudomonadota bacterium]
DSEIELVRQMRARLMAEEELARKSQELSISNAELELANRDLEDYAAVISHDLASPLRGMRYIADDIEQHLGSHASAASLKSLADLRTQSRRMSSMLAALLDYASVGRKSEAVENVDTQTLVTEIANSIAKPDGFGITVDGHWPTFVTVRAPLDLVIRNLLDNAIKHHDYDRGRIVISASEHQDDPHYFEFSIQDDGPGIARKHQEAVFLPFRTLTTTEDVSGRGMGLAFVRRTIETLGGKVTIASNAEVERGTAFHIKWPLTITDKQSEAPVSTRERP